VPASLESLITYTDINGDIGKSMRKPVEEGYKKSWYGNGEL